MTTSRPDGARSESCRIALVPVVYYRVGTIQKYGVVSRRGVPKDKRTAATPVRGEQTIRGGVGQLNLTTTYIGCRGTCIPRWNQICAAAQRVGRVINGNDGARRNIRPDGVVGKGGDIGILVFVPYLPASQVGWLCNYQLNKFPDAGCRPLRPLVDIYCRLCRQGAKYTDEQIRSNGPSRIPANFHTKYLMYAK